MILTGANVPISQLTSASALRFLKNLLTLPYIAFVPIYPESFDTTRTAEVSTQLVISQSIGGKEFVTDNIAPGPRMWKIKGYIKGIDYIELSNWFMPSLMAQKLIIDNAHTSRKPVAFRTTDGEVLSVLIKECSFIEEPDNMNTVHIEATLQELNYMTVNTSIPAAAATSKGLEKSLPLIGKSLGKAHSVGGVLLGYTAITGGVLLSGLYTLLENARTAAEAAILTSVADLFTEEQAAKVRSMTIVPIPTFPVSEEAGPIENFTFSTVFPFGTIFFSFVYINSVWNITTELNSEVITYTLLPNMLLNPSATIFSLTFVSPLDPVGLDGIYNTQLVVTTWESAPA